MIFRRVLMALTAAAVFAAAAGVVVVALAFALYALAEPRLGRAGAAGAVALVVALLMGLLGLVLAIGGRRSAPKTPAQVAGNLLERALTLVQEKPVMAAVAAAGAGLMAIRNPKYLGEALKAFLDDKPARK